MEMKVSNRPTAFSSDGMIISLPRTGAFKQMRWDPFQVCCYALIIPVNYITETARLCGVNGCVRKKKERKTVRQARREIKVCRYQLPGKELEPKMGDHLHVDDSFSLNPFFSSLPLPLSLALSSPLFSLSVRRYHDDAHAIYFHALGMDCSSSAVAAFFQTSVFFIYFL